MFITIIAALFVLGVLIFIHELGHFLAAKAVGIRVETFSLGFPPRAFGKKIGDTDYCVSWIPVGGYVKMTGMIDESMDTKIEGKPYEFMSKKTWQKLLTISAGVIMNFLLAIFIFAAGTFLMGLPEFSPQVGKVSPDLPAAQAGMQVGDLILSIDGTAVSRWEDLTKIISSQPEKKLIFKFKRGDAILEKEVTPIRSKLSDGREGGIIGIGIPQPVMRSAGFFESIANGFRLFGQYSALMGRSIKRMISGEESFRQSIGGPIAIIKAAGDSARSGFGTLMLLTAILSMNLGYINIFPFPALDGGHFFIILTEWVVRRPLPTRAKLIIQQVGMAILLMLMVFIIYNDFVRFSIFQKIINWF